MGLWAKAFGDAWSKLEQVKKGLVEWVKLIKRKEVGIKRELTNKLGELLEKEHDDESLE